MMQSSQWPTTTDAAVDHYYELFKLAQNNTTDNLQENNAAAPPPMDQLVADMANVDLQDVDPKWGEWMPFNEYVHGADDDDDDGEDDAMPKGLNI